jgi:hypothetical protein
MTRVSRLRFAFQFIPLFSSAAIGVGLIWLAYSAAIPVI